MLVDSLTLLSNATINNAHVEPGTSFPLDASIGRLFYLTTNITGFDKGLYVYDGTTWITGDITSIITDTGLSGGGSSGTITISLATSGVIADTYKSVTVDATGRVIAGSNPTTYSAYGITDVQPLSTDLTAIDALVGTSGLLKKTATDTWTLDTNTYLTTITLTGDVTGSGTDTFATTLASVGTAGTYKSVTTDTKGRVTAGSNPTTLSGYGITDAVESSHLTDYTLHLTSDQNTWIDAITVTAAEVNYLSGVSSGIQAQLGTKLNLSGGTMTGSVVMQTGTKITLTDSPLIGTDAANKNYVDSNIAGLTWKESVAAGTTAAGGNITLSGTQTIDGVTLIVGDRVLVKNQTLATENGIYVVSASAWSRSSDMDQTTPINEINSAALFIEQGTVNAATGWTQINNITTLDTDPIAFSQFTGAASFTAGIGLTQTGNIVNINLGAGIVQLPTDEVGIDVYSTGGLMTTLDGITNSADTNSQLSLTAVGTAGTYKSVTTDIYGRVTAGSNPTTLSGYGITDAQPLGADLTAIDALTGTSGFLKKTAADTWILDNSISSTVGYQLFTATASQSVFTLTNFINDVGTNRMQLFINGIKQIPPGNGVLSAYAETNTTTITLAVGLTVGDLVEVYFR